MASPPAPRASAHEEELFDEAFMRQLELLSVVARRIIRGRQRAERKTQKIGSGLEFADHRQYSPGDDIRQVDWQVLSRLDQRLVRLYEEDEDLPIQIVVDVSASMHTAGARKARLAKRIAAALAYVGLAGLDRVGVSAVAADRHETLPATRGKARIFRILEFLRKLEPGGATDLLAGCRRVAQRTRTPGVTVVVSDCYDLRGAFAGPKLLRFRKHEAVLVQVLDRAEADPRSTGLRGDVDLVDCEGGSRRELTLSPRILARFAEAHERFCAQLERNCRSRGIPYFRAYVDEDFEQLVLRIFREGGVLR